MSLTCGIKYCMMNIVMPYINFYENKFKFRGKTIYNPKYCHIKHTLNSYDKSSN